MERSEKPIQTRLMLENMVSSERAITENTLCCIAQSSCASKVSLAEHAELLVSENFCSLKTTLAPSASLF
jgi:hypothetical protein